MIEDGSPKTQTDLPMAENDLRIALKTFKLGILRSLQICFPASVYSYDRSTHTAVVMPLIKQGFYNGKWSYIRRKPFSVSVRNIQCGGFTIDVPLYVGDTGWVFSSDRDTLLLKQEGALTNSVLEGNRSISIVEDDYQQQPNQPLLHDLASGFFIPDNWGNWENTRYKDNPNIAVGSSLYIGSSIDTNDNRDDTSVTVKVDGKDVKKEKVYQKGNSYENKSTSSLVMLSDGGISMASSTDTKTNRNSNVTASNGEINIAAEDRKNNKASSVKVSTDSGIVISQDSRDEKSHFICSINDGTMLMRMMSESSVLSFYIKDGKINVTTSNDINMNIGGKTNIRCAGTTNITNEGQSNIHSIGDVNVKSEGNVNVSSVNARVVSSGDATLTANVVRAVAAKTANVNAGESVNVGAASTTNINAGGTVNLAAGKIINVTAPDSVKIVTASDTTIMAKKKGASVSVSTLSKESNIEILMKGKSSNLNIEMEEEKSNISITADKRDSSISIESKGNNSPVNVKSSGSSSGVFVSANGDGSSVSVSSKKNVNVSASEKVAISAKGIVVSGDVEVNGSLKLNANPFKEKTHVIDKNNNAEYWSWK